MPCWELFLPASVPSGAPIDVICSHSALILFSFWWLQISTFYEWLGAQPPSDCATDEDPYCFQYVRELSEGGKALQQLIDYAAGKPEVRFVTYSDLIRWVQVRVVQGLGGVGAAVG